MKRIAIVGVGNRLMGDDGFGSYMAEALYGNVKGCDVIDLGAAGASAMEVLKDYDIIILIDAVAMDKDFDISRMDINIDSDEVTSTILDFEYSGSHGVGIQSILTTLKIMGYAPEVYLVGCKPYVLDVKLGLSEELRRKLDQIVLSLAEFLKKNFGIEVIVDDTIKKLYGVVNNN
ncbi:hydrogenase maturation protease [Saccharolobus islandicus]|uniref:hydrogenase maturation protease n=1 Tax=Saccharolobus islandicus TaxID=43080 RepID=UPI00035EC762|nr:hydrogenase maturation protease [Sulfolobus islandicus]